MPEGGPSSSSAAAASGGSAEERVKRWRTRAEAQLLALDMVRGSESRQQAGGHIIR